MELKDAIELRRSIRKYKDEDISEDIILELIRCATLAPSGHNRQPWKFQIVRGDLKNKIADILIEKTKDIKGATAPFTANVIKQAPALVVVYLLEENKDYELFDILSIGGAIENFILRATDLNLGTLWIGDTKHIEEEMKEILGSELRIVSTIAVGYKDQEPHARPRREFEENIIKTS